MVVDPIFPPQMLAALLWVCQDSGTDTRERILRRMWLFLLNRAWLHGNRPFWLFLLSQVLGCFKNGVLQAQNYTHATNYRNYWPIAVLVDVLRETKHALENSSHALVSSTGR